MGVFCMFSGIILMSICVIIIGGNFEQAHQNMLTDKAMMKKKPPADPAVKNTDAIKPICETLPERQVSHIYGHTDPEEKVNRYPLPSGEFQQFSVCRGKTSRVRLAI